MTHRNALLVGLALAAAVVVGCDEPEATVSDSLIVEPAAELPADLVLAEAPDGAGGVAAVRESAEAGETVVVEGVVGGRVDPIAEARAIFTLLDDVVVTCDEMGDDDHCATPWDACCEPQEKISANAATVQVVDAEGRPLRLGLAGVGGLEPLSRVRVVGTFQPSPDGAAAAINATGLHVVQ